jgi:hypothetical protein
MLRNETLHRRRSRANETNRTSCTWVRRQALCTDRIRSPRGSEILLRALPPSPPQGYDLYRSAVAAVARGAQDASGVGGQAMPRTVFEMYREDASRAPLLASFPSYPTVP